MCQKSHAQASNKQPPLTLLNYEHRIRYPRPIRANNLLSHPKQESLSLSLQMENLILLLYLQLRTPSFSSHKLIDCFPHFLVLLVTLKTNPLPPLLFAIPDACSIQNLLFWGSALSTPISAGSLITGVIEVSDILAGLFI